jgi:NAD(P)-dependent dehydrogenase (short-subunit alcohol dehydrogenase family)
LVETFEIDEYPSSLIPNCNVAPTQEVEKIYSGSGKLAGKAATITGGDSGSGRVVALDCTREGAGVLISYLESEKPDAQETIRAVENSGKKTFAVPNDIQDGAYCQQIVEQAVFESGKIDVLVNNTASNLAGVS